MQEIEELLALSAKYSFSIYLTTMLFARCEYDPLIDMYARYYQQALIAAKSCLA